MLSFQSVEKNGLPILIAYKKDTEEDYTGPKFGKNQEYISQLKFYP